MGERTLPFWAKREVTQIFGLVGVGLRDDIKAEGVEHMEQALLGTYYRGCDNYSPNNE